MDNEKRMADDYEIIQSFQYGGKEVVLGDKKILNDKERFMCAYCEKNFFYERYDECMVSGDYTELVELYAKRITDMVAEYKKSCNNNIASYVFTVEDCFKTTYDMSIEDRFIVIKAERLLREYQSAEHQLYLVTGGNGAHANARGRTVFVTNVYDGENTRFYREDVLGIIRENRIPDWAKEKVAAMQPFYKEISDSDYNKIKNAKEEIKYETAKYGEDGKRIIKIATADEQKLNAILAGKKITL